MDLESQIRHLHGPEEVTYAPDELVVVCLVRDGRPYLKSFIEHYFSLGVKHIVFLDNGSTDGTVSVAQSYENVTILQTELSFKEHQGFMKRYLVTRFGRDRWILYVDIDELFDYPYSDMVGLSSFLRYLTEKSYTAVVAQMLDMFPDKPLSGRASEWDEPLKELHRFYDISDIRRQSYYSRDKSARNTVASEEIEIYRDGIRKTIFENGALLTKHPLMFIDEDRRPVARANWVGGAHVADITCVLFHYMFAGDFYGKAVRAVKEANYSRNSRKYKKFVKTLEQDPELQIKRETAQELESVNDLVDNQFLVISADYMAWVYSEESKSASENDVQGDGAPRWLIEAFSMISARARTQARLARVLEHQVERLKRNLATERQEAKNRQAEKRSTKDSAKNRQAGEHWKTKNSQLREKHRKAKKDWGAKNRRRIEELKNLKERNRDLERQMRDIQGSRSWKLLGKISRIRAKVMPRRG
jgi:glycosyltransferase involved in cell wall biosynthesis